MMLHKLRADYSIRLYKTILAKYYPTRDPRIRKSWKLSLGFLGQL